MLKFVRFSAQIEQVINHLAKEVRKGGISEARTLPPYEFRRSRDDKTG